MTRKFLIPGALAFLLASCTTLPFASPPTPTVIIPIITPVSTAVSIQPSATNTPKVDLEATLVQQVANDLNAFPRPACEAGKQSSPEWTSYTQGLAATLRKLVADPRAQSLTLPALTNIFSQASSLIVDTVEGTNEFALVTIVKANCPQRLGGGSSPTSPRDSVFVINRRGDMWDIGQVANVLKAVWVNNHWNVLVTQTQWGNAQDFEMWLVTPTGNEWKKESKLKFNQLYGDPLPKLGVDGLSVTLYAYAASCNITKNPNASPLPTIESDYKFQNGEFQCVTSRLLATPTPKKP